MKQMIWILFQSALSNYRLLCVFNLFVVVHVERYLILMKIDMSINDLYISPSILTRDNIYYLTLCKFPLKIKRVACLIQDVSTHYGGNKNCHNPFSIGMRRKDCSMFIHLRIDRNFCSVQEEITLIRLYTPSNPRSGLRRGVYNLIEVISNEPNK